MGDRLRDIRTASSSVGRAGDESESTINVAWRIARCYFVTQIMMRVIYSSELC